jgi:hypothetical protein
MAAEPACFVGEGLGSEYALFLKGPKGASIWPQLVEELPRLLSPEDGYAAIG